MLFISRVLLLLINLDQETVLNWFGIENSTNQTIGTDFISTPFEFEPSAKVSLSTFKLIIEGLWIKIQDGLTLSDIETILCLILLIRFVVLALKYNLKTSFYITCISIFAGYLWYRHLIDVVSMYRNILLKLPFVHKMGADAIQLRSLRRQMLVTDLKVVDNERWYNPGQVLYSGLRQGIITTDPETGFENYIDPISMIISNLSEPMKSNILPYYYKIYNSIIPRIFTILSQFWRQLSALAGYVLIVRIGKKYCPYLVRWHWTFLLIISMVEQIFVKFIHRVYYFQTFVLLPQTKSSTLPSEINLDDINLQIEFFNVLLASTVLLHIVLIILGLLHAILGQYFYVPFFVENTELHIGPRPTNTIYSGGKTAWQDPLEKEKNFNRFFPKLWYGWFGRGTKHKGNWNIVSAFKRGVKKATKRIKKIIKKII
jgi:hypothetical protein